MLVTEGGWCMSGMGKMVQRGDRVGWKGAVSLASRGLVPELLCYHRRAGSAWVKWGVPAKRVHQTCLKGHEMEGDGKICQYCQGNETSDRNLFLFLSSSTQNISKFAMTWITTKKGQKWNMFTNLRLILGAGKFILVSLFKSIMQTWIILSGVWSTRN